MPKKFFDIIPPGKASVFSQPKEIVKEVRPKKRYVFKTTVFLIAFLIIVGIVGLLSFSKVKVEVWPEINEVVFSETIIIDLGANIDLEKGIIPGEILNDQKIASQEFSASGKTIKEQKAKGVIKVYNAYSTSSRTLIPSRFVSADGRLFWSLKKIVLPGAKYEKGKLVPSEKDVAVEASESGEEYNIGPTNFALPALAGTALYTTIYGRSFTSMTGGYQGEGSQITETDLSNAETILTNQLKNDSRKFLQTSVSSDVILLSEVIKQEVLEINSSHEAGTEVASFNLEVKVGSQGLTFKQSDIDRFINSRINLKIENNEKIRRIEIDYLLKEIDWEAGKMIIDLKVKAKTYININLDQIKKALLGKSIKEAELFLDSLDGVERINLNSQLFFKRNISNNINKLEIKLMLDPSP